jgi:hypothetical protein
MTTKSIGEITQSAIDTMHAGEYFVFESYSEVTRYKIGMCIEFEGKKTMMPCTDEPPFASIVSAMDRATKLNAQFTAPTAPATLSELRAEEYFNERNNGEHDDR